ncbi:MAG: hypothetical protein H6624_20030 [Bdellovibrionaceae bacterium]|nr:hypothetical protein [Bdellovibrionales bacterium]MCB9086641.1 hypothetical protein [Pseudobdellovibrionaceae bacterium]
MFVHLTSALAQAQYFTGPISSGLGSTGRAATEPEEGVFLNPAILPHAKDFSSALYYADGELAENQSGTDLAVSFVDNTEGIFMPGSLSYVRRRRNYPGLPSVNEEYWHVGLGKFVTEYVSVGLGIHYRSVDQEGGEDFTYWNATLGALWAPKPEWGLALVGHNLTAKDIQNRAGYLEDLPRVGAGFVYLFDRILKARVDVVKPLEENPEDKFQLGLGVETYPNEFSALRVGYELDDLTKHQFVALGLAFLGPRLKIDYSFRKNTKSGSGGMHSVDFRVPF